MRVSFSSENDFNATYYLPGYGCVAEVEVKNGIVTLDVHDEGKVESDSDVEVSDETTQYCNGVPCYQPLDGEYENGVEWGEVDNNTIEDELIDFFDNVDDVDDEVTIEVEEDETPIEETEEYKFVKAIQKIDKDGSILALLDSLTKNNSVRNVTKKASVTFNNVIKELSDALDMMK